MIEYSFNETILFPCIGGILISLSTSINFYLKGRITGFSGILYNLWTGDLEKSENEWRWSFIYGLISACCLLSYFHHYSFFESQSEFLAGLSLLGFIICGFLVGFGTKLSNGCTSGHGVCGLPRLSLRSFLAVLLFCLSGIVSATIKSNYFNEFSLKNPLLDMHINLYSLKPNHNYMFHIGLFIILTILFIVYSTISIKNRSSSYIISDILIGTIVGFIFGLGLVISGMVKRSKVLNFLTLSKNWDPSLLFVLGSSVLLNLLTFNLVLKKTELPPFSKEAICVNKNNFTIDFNLVIGSILFGVGWGIGGICPGPLICDLFFYFPQLAIFLIFVILGQFAGCKVMIYTKDIWKCNCKCEKKGDLLHLELNNK